MTKNKFLKELEKKLEILNEEERMNIVEKYRTSLEEKIKNGKTEKQAVMELGDIDTLVKKILKSHKTNSEHSKEKEAAIKTKEIMDEIESQMKKIGKFLSRGFQNIIHQFKDANGRINLDHVFEIIIKTFFSLIIFVIFQFPFSLLEEIGIDIIQFMIFPFDKILSFFWILFLRVFYFFICILITFRIFHKYFKEEKSTKTKQSIETNHSKEKNNFSILTIIFRILITIFVFLPVWCLNFLLICAMIILVYLQIKGVFVLGILLILIGISLLLGYFVDVIKTVLFTKKQIFFFPFILSAILLVSGGLLFARTSLNYQYYNTLEESALKKEDVQFISTNEKIRIDNNGTKEFVIDSSLPDGTVKIVITYYDQYQIKQIDNQVIISFERKRDNEEIFNLVLEDLKQNKIFNYDAFNTCNVVIYTNLETRENVD